MAITPGKVTRTTPAVAVDALLSNLHLTLAYFAALLLLQVVEPVGLTLLVDRPAGKISMLAQRHPPNAAKIAQALTLAVVEEGNLGAHHQAMLASRTFRQFLTLRETTLQQRSLFSWYKPTDQSSLLDLL